MIGLTIIVCVAAVLAGLCFYLYCALKTLRLRIKALQLSLKTSEEDYERQRKRIRELELRLTSQSTCRLWMRDMLQRVLVTAPASLFDTQWDMEKEKREKAENSVD